MTIGSITGNIFTDSNGKNHKLSAKNIGYIKAIQKLDSRQGSRRVTEIIANPLSRGRELAKLVAELQSKAKSPQSPSPRLSSRTASRRAPSGSRTTRTARKALPSPALASSSTSTQLALTPTQQDAVNVLLAEDTKNENRAYACQIPKLITNGLLEATAASILTNIATESKRAPPKKRLPLLLAKKASTSSPLLKSQFTRAEQRAIRTLRRADKKNGTDNYTDAQIRQFKKGGILIAIAESILTAQKPTRARSKGSSSKKALRRPVATRTTSSSKFPRTFTQDELNAANFLQKATNDDGIRAYSDGQICRFKTNGLLISMALSLGFRSKEALSPEAQAVLAAARVAGITDRFDLYILERGRVQGGLFNLGNTCWFNSLVQALFKSHGPYTDILSRIARMDTSSLPPTKAVYKERARLLMRIIVLSEKEATIENNIALYQALKRFIQDLHHENEAILGRFNIQEDAPEGLDALRHYLGFTDNELDYSIKRHIASTAIMRGKTLFGLRTKTRSAKQDPLTFVPLPNTPGAALKSLQSLIKSISHTTETLAGDDGTYFNRPSKDKEATVQNEFFTLGARGEYPLELSFGLPRYDYNYATQSFDVDNTPIIFPNTVRLPIYNKTGTIVEGTLVLQKDSITCNSGRTPSSGHYVTYKFDEETLAPRLYNDNRVTLEFDDKTALLVQNEIATTGYIANYKTLEFIPAESRGAAPADEDPRRGGEAPLFEIPRQAHRDPTKAKGSSEQKGRLTPSPGLATAAQERPAQVASAAAIKPVKAKPKKKAPTTSAAPVVKKPKPKVAIEQVSKIAAKTHKPTPVLKKAPPKTKIEPIEVTTGPAVVAPATTTTPVTPKIVKAAPVVKKPKPKVAPQQVATVVPKLKKKAPAKKAAPKITETPVEVSTGPAAPKTVKAAKVLNQRDPKEKTRSTTSRAAAVAAFILLPKSSAVETTVKQVPAPKASPTSPLASRKITKVKAEEPQEETEPTLSDRLCSVATSAGKVALQLLITGVVAMATLQYLEQK